MLANMNFFLYCRASFGESWITCFHHMIRALKRGRLLYILIWNFILPHPMRLRTVYVVVYDLNAQPRRKAVLAFYITLFWWLKKKKKVAHCCFPCSLLVVTYILILVLLLLTKKKRNENVYDSIFILCLRFLTFVSFATTVIKLSERVENSWNILQRNFTQTHAIRFCRSV